MTFDIAGSVRRSARVRQAHLRAVERNSVDVAPLGSAVLWQGIRRGLKHGAECGVV